MGNWTCSFFKCVQCRALRNVNRDTYLGSLRFGELAFKTRTLKEKARSRPCSDSDHRGGVKSNRFAALGTDGSIAP